MKDRQEFTEGSVMGAIKHGARSLGDVVKAHGYSSVCGPTTAKLKKAVPDVQKLIEAAEAGKALRKPNRKSLVTFRDGTLYRKAVELSVSHGEMRAKEFDRLLAKEAGALIRPKTATREACAAAARRVTSDIGHTSNGGKSINVSTRRGWVLIQPLQPAAV